MPQFAIGVDYGTNSVRALVVDVADGREIATAVYDYPSGDAGVLLDERDPNLARQNPADYIEGFRVVVRSAVQLAWKDATFSADEVVGLGIDTTGSSPIPIDADGRALALDPLFQNNLAAHCWLWKDHTGYAEAAEITEKASAQGRPFLEKCGGTYSSEWFWSKILRCARVAPDVFAAAYSWVELQDYVPAYVTGTSHPSKLKRGICAAGHKAMYHTSWGGLPDAEFLTTLDPRLGELRSRLYESTVSINESVGGLTPEMAAATGLPVGLPVATGAFDAHLGAVGSGVRPGTLVKIMGTSTCDIMVGDASTPDIPGVCGVVPGSVIPGMIGIEAGQSAVGDLFNWGTRVLGKSHEELTVGAEQLMPGESGLIALDWNNGNRTILVDPLLSGLIVGQSLHTTPSEVYRALVEATAFGTLTIIRQIEKSGVPVEEIVVCGGIGEKSPMTMQIYADVCNRPFKTSRSAQTCALGSAIAGSVVGGAYGDFAQAIQAMTGTKERVFVPNPASVAVYAKLYALYLDLHDAFGKTARHPNLQGLMKSLIAIRQEVRN